LLGALVQVEGSSESESSELDPKSKELVESVLGDARSDDAGCGFRIVMAQPPPPAPVSFVQPTSVWSISSRMRSSFGCDTPSDTSRPWLMVMRSPRCCSEAGWVGSKSGEVMSE